MKRMLKILLVLLILGGAGAAGFVYWKQMQEAKVAEAPPAEQPVAGTLPSPTAPTGAYDLAVQADGMSKAVATLTMEKGETVKFRFFTNDAPATVKRITDLISQGFYNGIVFHRVVPNFVAQAGDPTGTGSGGSGVKLKAEFNARKHEAGILSMARLPSDVNSADSQFFIMLGTMPQLDGQYTVFGKAVEGYENVLKIQRGDKIKTFTIQ